MPGALMHPAPADVVAVFSKIGQVAEIGEGPDHTHGLLAAQAFEQFFHLPLGIVVSVAPECDREFADTFDQVKRGGAILLANHVAEQPAEQADVLHQGHFGKFCGLCFCHQPC